MTKQMSIQSGDKVYSIPDDGQIRTVKKIDRVGADVRVWFEEGGYAQYDDLRKINR